MDATRTRPWLAEAATPRRRLRLERNHVSAHVGWAVDAAILLVGLLVALLLVRELRSAPWASDTTTPAAASTDMPREAVSVPALMLAAGREVHVGEARDAAVASLGSLTLLRRTEEPGPLGAREVRSYQGVTLVLEPFERAGDPRVAAIYLQ
jgi:hypothetical protein